MAKQTAKQAMLLLCRLGTTSKRCRSSRLACILFSVVHLLPELLRFLLVNKAECSQAILELESMKESSVLIVMPCIEYFLVPDDAAIGTLCGKSAREQRGLVVIVPDVPRYPPS